jgi:polar amino acid transport system substrate-binding protein
MTRLTRHALLAAAAGIGALLAAGAAHAQADKPITVGLDGTFAPHAMPKVGGKPGEVEGFNVDLANEIARRLKRPINIVAQEFSGLIPALNAGRFDWLAAPTTVTPERAKNLLFTEGYLNTYYQIVLKKSSPDIARLEDLKGKKVTVNKGSAYDKWADTNKDRYGFEVLAFPTQTDAVQAVMAGRADANLGGNTVVAWAAKQNPTLKLGARIDEGLMWAAPFRKDDVAGRNQVENAIECMKLDGTIAKLHEKWFGTKPEPGSAAVTVFKGYGVPGTEGHDPAEHKPQCG